MPEVGATEQRQRQQRQQDVLASTLASAVFEDLAILEQSQS